MAALTVSYVKERTTACCGSTSGVILCLIKEMIRHKRINRNPYYLDFKCSLKSIYHRNDFKDIRTMVLTIGFNNAGSSLLGYLLTTHPNMVIAHEIMYGKMHDNPFVQEAGVAYLHRKYNGFLSKLFYIILATDLLRYQNAAHHDTAKDNKRFVRNKRVHYVLVPNQHQGRFERLNVIGVKASTENSMVLLRNNTLVNLRAETVKYFV